MYLTDIYKFVYILNIIIISCLESLWSFICKEENDRWYWNKLFTKMLLCTHFLMPHHKGLRFQKIWRHFVNKVIRVRFWVCTKIIDRFYLFINLFIYFLQRMQNLSLEETVCSHLVLDSVASAHFYLIIKQHFQSA